jgi:hypothetical protein
MLSLAAASLAAPAAQPVAAQAAAQRDAGWSPAAAPLMTRWAKDVRPDRVRPEYPRPLLVRKDWKSLNGLWEFAFDDENAGRRENWHQNRPLPLRILVPFTYEAALSGIGKGAEIHERVWYRRTFDVPAGWRDRRVKLNFGAVDWDTTVWVNGTEVGRHVGGYAPFSFDVTDALKPRGPQEVVVAVHDPADPRRGAFQPKGKQLGSEGIWYTRTTGIWQSVWLEPVADAHIETVTLTPGLSPDGKSGTLSVQVGLAGRNGTGATSFEATVLQKGKPLVTGTVSVSSGGRMSPTIVLAAPQVQAWTPENPVLYDLRLTVKQGGKVVDQASSYTAFRSVGIANGRLTLNGKPYFYRGVLDQGYWPDGILTPPTDAALRFDVEMTKRMGFNMSRKHVKVEDPRWYYWCDRLGLAVWQDMPSSHNLQSAEAKRNFTNEWREVMQTTRSYPSVVHWIPFNENWGDPNEFQDEIVRLTRRIDPSRPITDASGWTQRSLTDVIDTHNYSNNLISEGVQNPVKPKVVGEYGGIALPIPGHTWTTGWGYQTARDEKGLLRRIGHQTTQLFVAPNLSGFVYTQLTDVEQEMNGLLTYDRLQKSRPERLAAIFQGVQRSELGGFVKDWLVLGPIPAGTDLRTADSSPAAQAAMTGVLAREILPNEAGLQPTDGQSVTVAGKTLKWQPVKIADDALDFHKVFFGNQNNVVAYAAVYVDSPAGMRNVTLLLGSDDAAKVWLNGREVWSVNRIRGVSLDEDMVPGLTLKAGRNLLLVKVAQGIGGWGLAVRFELPDGKILRIAGR